MSENSERIKLLEEKITDLKKRFPAHSLKPQMMQELEELEEELADLRRLSFQQNEAGNGGLR